MKLYQLHAKQKLPISVDEAWEFLSSPENLKVITPDYMGFHILSGADRPMYPGQIIQYIVTPVAGIKTKWVTEITHVVDKQYFVDEQRVGPYTIWHHQHILEPIPQGVLMKDIVSYKPPFGFLGAIANSLMIKTKLNEIFDYRTIALEKRFGRFSN